MVDEAGQSNSGDHEVDALVAEYMIRVDEGEQLTPDSFIHEHPDHAKALEKYFADLGRVDRALQISDSVEHQIVAGQSLTIASALRSGFSSVPAQLRTPRDAPLEQIGDYMILDTIGRGGMGTVYRAWQPSLGRVVALKVSMASGDPTDPQIRRFISEAESMATLDHPGIVHIYDVGSSGNKHFITMECIDAGSLAERLRDSPLPPRESAELLAEVAMIVQYAHDRGVIHRDIKPSNILLDAEGRAHVSDFGLAKRVYAGEDLTLTGQVLGTPAFMPPEQARGEAGICRLSDVYALGAVLFATLTGRAPFQAATALETLRQVIDEDPPSLRTLNRQLPVDLETICRRCMEKETRGRYQSAREVSEELKRWLDGQPIQARRFSPVERSIKWARRRPAAAALFLVSFLAMAGVGAVAVALRENTQLESALSEVTSARDQERQARQGEAEARRKAELAEEQLRRTDYSHSLALARLQWQAGSTRRVDQLLRDCPKERRGWEWYFLRNLNHQESMDADFGGRSISFSGDGRTLFTSRGSLDRPNDPLVYLREPETGLILKSIGRRPRTFAHLVQANRDGTWCLIHSVERGRAVQGSNLWQKSRLERYDTATARLSRTYFDGSPLLALHSTAPACISPDDRFIAASLAEDEDPRVVIWDAETAETKYEFRVAIGTPLSIAFSSDSRLLAGVTNRNDVVIWRLDDHAQITTLSLEGRRVTGDNLIKFSPDGEFLVVTIGNVIQFWDTKDWQPKRRIETKSGNRTFAFNSSGEILAVSGERATIDLWDVNSGTLLGELHGHGEFVAAVAFTPSDKLVSHANSGPLKYWDPNRQLGEARILSFTEGVKSIAFSGDGKTIAAAGGPPNGPQGDFLAVVNVATGDDVFTKSDHTAAIQSAVFAGDETLATGSWDHRVGVWDAEGNAVFLDDGVQNGLESVDADPGGRWIAAGGGYQRKGVVIWNRRSEEIETTLKPDPDERNPLIQAIRFSPDGRLIAAATEFRWYVWRTSDWKLEQMLSSVAPTVPTSPAVTFSRITSIVFSPDSKGLATSHTSGLARFWNIQSGKLLTTFVRHSFLASDLAFSPDGKRLATCSFDGNAKIWDVATGDELLSLTGHVGRINGVAFSPDGSLLATGGEDGTVRIYDGTP